MKENPRPSKRPAPRIRLQLLGGFLLFAVVILSLIWIFQILLLNPFYERIKTAEIKRTAQALAGHYDTDTFKEHAIEQARATNTSFLVVASDGSIRVGYNPHTYQQPLIWGYGPTERYVMFQEAGESDGSFLKKYEISYRLSGEESKGMIYALQFQAPDQQTYLLLLETEITPVDATVQTLQYQLIWITITMLLFSIALAVFIASKISRPIVSINNSAKRLAQGDYAPVFSGTGSRETAELAQTLNFAATELSKTEALRRELLANVSHDLRTPLTMIRGYSEVMRDLPGETTPENIQVIIDETAHLTDLVNDLLDLSKLEAGTTPLHVTVFNLTESVTGILNRYRQLMDFSFPFHCTQDMPVCADELKISQVFYNLLNNAINYAGTDKEVTVSLAAAGGRVRCSVTDHGDGIPPEQLRNIWDRYYKVDKTHKRAQVGTGLGLSIVKNILDLHQSTYGVTSTVGIGSTFWFELPLYAAPAPPIPPEGAPPAEKN